MEEKKTVLDRLIYLAALGAPIANLPQLFQVWSTKSAQGVSLLSWTLFAVISLVWLAYGIEKRDKPIILMYALLVIIQMGIALGTHIYV